MGLVMMMITETSHNHRKIWIEKDLKDHLILSPLPWAETLSVRPGFSKPNPAWP